MTQTTRNLLILHWLLTLVAGQSEGQQLVKLAAVNSRPRSSQDRKQSPPVLTLTELEHKLRKKVMICRMCVLCTVFLDTRNFYPTVFKMRIFAWECQFQWTRHHRLTNIFHLPFTNNSSLQRSLAETIRLVHTPGSKQFPMKSFCCSDLLTNLLEKKSNAQKYWAANAKALINSTQEVNFV